MLFAAGFGTRMKHLTAHQPKPLVHVAGRPLIDHALDYAYAVEPKTILANLHYLPHMLETHLADTNVRTITESPDILETGGGLRNALPILGNGPVVTMNTDAIWSGPNPVKLALDAWQPDTMDALLVCIPVDKPSDTTVPVIFLFRLMARSNVATVWFTAACKSSKRIALPQFLKRRFR